MGKKPDFDHIECPKCKSEKISSKQIGIGQIEYTCKDCGHVWRNFNTGDKLGDILK